MERCWSRQSIKVEMWEWYMAVNRLFPEPVGSTVWPDKTRGEHFECPAHQAASEWFQTQSYHSSRQRRWEKWQWKQLWVTRAFLWNNGHLDILKWSKGWFELQNCNGSWSSQVAPETVETFTWHPSHSPTLDAQLIHHSNSNEFLHVESILWKGKWKL